MPLILVRESTAESCRRSLLLTRVVERLRGLVLVRKCCRCAGRAQLYRTLKRPDPFLLFFLFDDSLLFGRACG